MILRKLVYILGVVVTGVAVTGCGGILEDLEPCEGEVWVEYDWSRLGYYSFTMPEGMTSLFYPEGGGDYWRFETTWQGGVVTPPVGETRVAAFNNDTRSVIWGGFAVADSLYAYTMEGDVLGTVESRYRGAAPPRIIAQPMRKAPDAVFVADTLRDIDDRRAETVVKLTVRQFTPLYTIVVEDVENLESASACSASLSGLAAGRYLLSGRRMDVPVSMPSAMTISDSGMSGSMFCFGPSTERCPRMLSIYVWLRDGQKQMYTFDVSDVVDRNAESLMVTIRVSGLRLPEVDPVPDAGGMDVDVDNWTVENIELSN